MTQFHAFSYISHLIFLSKDYYFTTVKKTSHYFYANFMGGNIISGRFLSLQFYFLLCNNLNVHYMNERDKKSYVSIYIRYLINTRKDYLVESQQVSYNKNLSMNSFECSI